MSYQGLLAASELRKRKFDDKGEKEIDDRVFCESVRFSSVEKPNLGGGSIVGGTR